jgi:putative Ca2+/H+ antiporter (TMEM165/GDT1 family)
MPIMRSVPAVGPLLANVSLQTGFLHVLFQSFCLVAIAELFDKTWFVALLMAMNHPKNVVFWACYLALVAHTLIAACFGYVVSRAMPIQTLHFVAAGMYGIFAMLYAKDFYSADPSGDVIAAGKEEASEAITNDDNYGSASPDSSGKGGNTSSDVSGKGKRGMVGNQVRWTKIFSKCFIAMFIAEWGDRTQIAMIGQHASQPLIPVCIGSLAAFFLLTASAVMAGAVLSDKRVSERGVYFISTISFTVFAALALRDGLAAQPVDMR